MERPSTAGHIARVNDIEMYYEIRGEGEPLVLNLSAAIRLTGFVEYTQAE